MWPSCFTVLSFYQIEINMKGDNYEVDANRVEEVLIE